MRLRDRLVTSLLGLLVFPLRVLLRQEQVHILHPRIDRGGCRALQSGIERRINAEILAQQFVLGVLVEQVVLHHVDEIRRFTPRNRGPDNLQRRALGILNVFHVDVFVVEHLRQHAIAGLYSALRVTVGGRIIIWRANDSREVGAFGQRQLPQILSKVGDAGLRESANSKAPAVAEVNFVGIQLENLLFVEALLDLDGNHGFG